MSKKNYKDYLDKTFLEELNYKIWTTKGSRFNANKRLLLIYKCSTLANSMLSVYLIAIGLLSVYKMYNDRFIEENILPYTITCLSILLLIFSQIENSKNYQLKAKEFHSCGIELSKLYNKLRTFKTFNLGATEKEKELFAQDISEQYEGILEKYENHDPIDYALFKTTNPEYFELGRLNVLEIKLNYYLKSQFLYHLMIIAPPVIILAFICFNS
jgi:hypothetical protein